MIDIHPTAIVSSKAKIGEGCSIGPYSIIDENVTFGQGTRIDSHVVVKANTRIGNDCRVYPFCVIGAEPQHLSDKGDQTGVEIGDRVILRESVTIHRGTNFDRGLTSIGNDCYIMAYSHVAHDCEVANRVIMANTCQLGGHVKVGNCANIGGQVAVTQHSRIGSYCFIGGGSLIRKDVAPFLAGKGNEFKIQRVNTVGLERHGFSPDTIRRIRGVYKVFFLQKLTVARAIEQVISQFGESDEIHLFLDFVRNCKSGLAR